MKYHVIVTVHGEGFHYEFAIPGIMGSMVEDIVETYIRDGYRHPEPNGWVYYPPHVIQRIMIKGKK